MSYSQYYMTPERFMAALSDAMHDAYYPDGSWTAKHHPEDLATNTITVCEGVAAFMSSLIRNESTEKRKQDEGLDRLLAALREAKEQPDYSALNDAYVDTEDEA